MTVIPIKLFGLIVTYHENAMRRRYTRLLSKRHPLVHPRVHHPDLLLTPYLPRGFLIFKHSNALGPVRPPTVPDSSATGRAWLSCFPRSGEPTVGALASSGSLHRDAASWQLVVHRRQPRHGCAQISLTASAARAPRAVRVPIHSVN